MEEMQHALAPPKKTLKFKGGENKRGECSVLKIYNHRDVIV
jgi:hypothetical protein